MEGAAGVARGVEAGVAGVCAGDEAGVPVGMVSDAVAAAAPASVTVDDAIRRQKISTPYSAADKKVQKISIHTTDGTSGRDSARVDLSLMEMAVRTCRNFSQHLRRRRPPQAAQAPGGQAAEARTAPASDFIDECHLSAIRSRRIPRRIISDSSIFKHVYPGPTSSTMQLDRPSR